MAFFGLQRGQRKIIGQVRLVTNGSSVTTRYRDGVSEGVVTYSTSGYLELVSAVQNTQNINLIEVFCSEGFTSTLATGASGSEVFLMYVIPGGEGVMPVRIDAGTRIAILPLTTPPVSTEFVINFFG